MTSLKEMLYLYCILQILQHVSSLFHMSVYFRSLQYSLAELHEYHSKQKEWLKYQEKLIWEQAPLDVRLMGEDHTLLLANRGK